MAYVGKQPSFKKIKYTNSAETQYVSLAAPSAQASNIDFILPGADGSAGNVLITDGSKNLSFTAISTPVANVAANDSNVVFTAANARTQVCTPTANRTYTLPTTSILAGDTWTFVNNATAFTTIIVLNASGGSSIGTILGAGGSTTLVALVNTPTTPAHWSIIRQFASGAFTPSVTGGSGVYASGTITANPHSFNVVNNVVSFSGSVSVAGGTSMATAGFNISLPILTTTFSTNNQACGAVASTQGSAWVGQLNSNNGATTIGVLAVSTGTNVTMTLRYSGTYIIV